MLTTSLALLDQADAGSIERRRRLAEVLGGESVYGRDTPIPIRQILETNGLEDALWALFRAVPDEQAAERHRVARLFAQDWVDRVGHRSPDSRSADEAAAAERPASGETTEVVATAVRAAGVAKAAAEAARAAADAAKAAAEAIGFGAKNVPWDAARISTWDAAWSAGKVASWAAAKAAWEAADAARMAADAAWGVSGCVAALVTDAAERKWQSDRLAQHL